MPPILLPTEATLRRSLQHSRRLVLKVGSALLRPEPGKTAVYGRLARELDVLLRSGRQVVLVSSGAIAVGLQRLQVARRPRSLAALQAAAAVGQPLLMAHWADALAGFGRTAAQVLLTHADLAHRGRFLNARRALCHLLQRGVVPIINENDSVATEEIKFGDNDQLAAQVAALVDADLLVLLTSVDGLHRGNPLRSPATAKVTLVRSPQALAQLSHFAAAAPAQAVGTGGMQSKLVAVQTATSLGVPVVIAHGRRQHPLQNIVRGAPVGTLFLPQQPLRQRHHRIAHRHNVPRAAGKDTQTMTQPPETLAPSAAAPDPAARLHAQLRALALQAQAAARPLVRTSAAQRTEAIAAMATCLQHATDQVLEANAQDLRSAAESGLSAALQDRLALGPKRLQSLQAALMAIAAQPDPIGQQTPRTTLQNGLQMHRQRLPLGVILMIYESRPNVTLDAAALCLRSANVAILRGGSEALQTNLALVQVVKKALQQAGLPEACVQWVPTQERAAIDVLLTYDDCINLVIPRGGAGLIAHVVAHSRINVVRHDRGLCHIYVDATAPQQMACDIVHNAKVQRPGVCNAVETLLVARAAAQEFLPICLSRLQAAGVQIRGCAQTQQLVANVHAATEADWDTEFLAPILAVRVVDGLEEALAHIDQHGTHHTAAIVSADAAAIQTFLGRVDASCVVANASTRFNDGGELGLGAELGISTSRVHAYGAMGAASLTCEKFVLQGQGQIRS